MPPQLRVASPCTADWEKMPGGDQVRYCEQCKLSVYNFSALTSPEVEQLLARHTGRLCGRLYRRADGTILTRDCPVGLRFLVRRVSRVAGAALTALMSVGFATAQEATKNPPVVQIQNVNAGVEFTVVDPKGIALMNASIALRQKKNGAPIIGTTDASGNFRRSDLSPGKYSLAVQAPGFADTMLNLKLRSGKMEHSVIKMNYQVIVVGEVF
jgi:Carboxypeptidase regulatory-like domain